MSEIPPSFHSLEFEGPFTSCLNCQRPFDDLDEPYIVNKVFRGPECVFEFAICQTCKADTLKSFSEESKEQLRRFSENNPFLKKRSEKFGESQDHHDWTSECAHCGTPASEIKDFTTECLGFGNHMVYDPYPVMVCESCVLKSQELLSKSTRDQWDKFILDHFEGPPADALKPDGVPMLV